MIQALIHQFFANKSVMDVRMTPKDNARWEMISALAGDLNENARGIRIFHPR